MAKQLKIKLVRSMIGRPKDHRKTLVALGFRRMNQVVTQPDNPQTRGMVDKVAHLVQVIE